MEDVSRVGAIAVSDDDKSGVTLQVRLPQVLHKFLQDYADAQRVAIAVAARAAIDAGVPILESKMAVKLDLENKRLVNQKLEISVNQLHRKVERLQELLGELRSLPAVGAIADEILKLLEDV